MIFFRRTKFRKIYGNFFLLKVLPFRAGRRSALDCTNVIKDTPRTSSGGTHNEEEKAQERCFIF
ncbi:hypothetical protein E3E31_10770 [Thermococcus sp. M39]|uniref:hypothetical protein n=1 Tax=unclassified Thermococcus TaxID=2627626 RepID=UPI001439EB9D|nr:MULTISPECIES: hypothetical protein [unclassified Thermococcus]NJE08996.1 hypothetical protein [Thermococcus sp. M39]